MNSSLIATSADTASLAAAEPAQPAPRRKGGGRLPDWRPRRAPHLAIGALLVVACAAGFAVTASHLDHRRGVLALANPVTVGHLLTPGDLRAVSVVTGAGMADIPASRAASVVGQTMALSLPAGALLTPAELGQSETPTAGHAILAELMKPGQFPPDITAGTQILLIPSANPTSPNGAAAAPAGGGTAQGWAATVLGVQTLDDDQGSVLTVELATGDAHQAATASDLAALVVSAAGR